MNRSWLIVNGHLYYYSNLEQQSQYASMFFVLGYACVFVQKNMVRLLQGRKHFCLQMTKGKGLKLLLL